MKQVGIIGGGPAGLSCALWLKNLDFHPHVLEYADQAGGAVAKHFHPNNWLLGMNALPGSLIRDNMLEHAMSRGVEISTQVHLTQITTSGDTFTLEWRGGKIPADYLVVASGAVPCCPPKLRLLAKNFPGLIQVGPGNPAYLQLKGKSVAILGGGDNAFEHALLLSEQGNEVDIYLRGKPRARADFLNAARNNPSIHIHEECAVTDFKVTRWTVTLEANSTPRKADYLMVMYGFSPNTRWLPRVAPWAKCLLDANGFIQVDLNQRTSLPRIYAAGDVTNLQFPCIPVALAQGAVAAKAIASYDQSHHNI